MNVRPATPADQSAWLELRRQLWPGPSDDHAEEIRRFFAGESRDPLAVFVADDVHQRIVGFAELSIRSYAEGCETDRVAFLEGWFVAPAARRGGVGRALVAASEEWAGSQGCSEFASDAELDNEESAAAHRALGFTEAGSVRCFRKILAPTSGGPLLYSTLASWWPLMSPPWEYREEAAFYREVIQSAASSPLHTMLEIGSGGGHNASHLKEHYRMVLVDRSPGMLAVSARLNPECEHIAGDMRTVRLGREFDAVFAHDAVCYMTSQDDLSRAMETAFVHCKPGGVALFAPDYVRENFQPGTDHGGNDDTTRAMRWIGWTSDPDPEDTTYVVDYAYLMRESNRPVRVEHDRHLEGLFSRHTWLQLLSDAGFHPTVVPSDRSEFRKETREVFVCVKPVSSG
ncbi:MAG TPA: aminoglycoside 6'-N-acetyltransferase [Gemmatimonadaceae bacterium]|nr:aminoglycoside 6'-N-acetyltransferase [Gemmatimonadaceae bacterium]